jgi:hypothetical protein
MDEFNEKCVKIVSAKTETTGPSLCYYPLGWKLDAWYRYVEDSIKQQLPAIPQFDNLSDPYQGCTKAGGGPKGSKGTAKSSQGVTTTPRSEMDSPLKENNKAARRRKRKRDQGQVEEPLERVDQPTITSSMVEMEFGSQRGAVTQIVTLREKDERGEKDDPPRSKKSKVDVGGDKEVRRNGSGKRKGLSDVGAKRPPAGSVGS